MKDILTLGVESSCDETSVSVVKNGREILSNVIDTQIPIHEKYGGVVPEIASRNHIEAISRVTKKALKDANIQLSQIDAITPTYGPGLVGALLVGLSYAKSLAFANNIPLVGVNHITGLADSISRPVAAPSLPGIEAWTRAAFCGSVGISRTGRREHCSSAPVRMAAGSSRRAKLSKTQQSSPSKLPSLR